MLTADDTNHRLQFVEFVKTHADTWYREQLGHLYDCWDRWNSQFFNSEMVPPYLLLTDMQGARTMGDCSNISGFGGKSQIRLRQSILFGNFGVMKSGSKDSLGCLRVIEDTLLHEMIHQYQQEIVNNAETKFKGHGPKFRDICNEIGSELGFIEVRCSNQKSKEEIEKPLCAYWPHRLDADEYYLGAFPARISFGNRIKKEEKALVEEAEEYTDHNEEDLESSDSEKEEKPNDVELVTTPKDTAVEKLLAEAREKLSEENFSTLKSVLSPIL